MGLIHFAFCTDALAKMKILYKLAPVLMLAACGQPEPIPYESLAWVNNYYIKHPASSLAPTTGGWIFRGAKEYSGELRVGFLVPGPVNKNPKTGRAILSRVCPGPSEKIWDLLPSNNRIAIFVWTEDNEYKDSVTC